MTTPKWNPVSGFAQGFLAPFRALKLILLSPRILALVLIPMALNLGLYVLFFTYGSGWLSGLIQGWVQGWQTGLPAWLAWLAVLGQWGLKLLAWFLLVVVSALTFTVVGSLIAAPFNDILSEQTEKVYRTRLGITTGHERPRIGFWGSIKLELRRTFVLMTLGTVIFVLGFVPLMQVPVFILAAILLSFEYFGIPLSRRSPSLATVWAFTLKHAPTAIGLGAFLLVLVAIPFVSIAYIPLSVVAGTILVVDRHEGKRT